MTPSPDHVAWLDLLLGQPAGHVGGDVYHYPLMRILVAARSRGLQAIDGPYLKVRDVDGFRRSAASAAALGYDGKWVLHPTQIDAANQAFAPSAADYSRAAAIVEAYPLATTVQARGAVILGDEMIDEASRKMAEAIMARGNAAGFTPGKTGEDSPLAHQTEQSVPVRP